MYPYILPSILGEHLSSYGFMLGIGVLVCLLVFHYYAKKLGLDPKFIDFVEWLGMLSIIMGVVSAMLFQNLYDYIADPEHFKWSMSLTFMGGLIGGVVTFLIGYYFFGRKYNSKIIDILSIASCCITVAHAFGRIGCFLAGCCYGMHTDSIFGMEFPYGNSYGKVLPTQLYESIFLFIMFGILSLITLKTKTRLGLGAYMIAYGIWRFIIEFFRDDYRGSFVGNLTPSQFWSIVMFILGILLCVYIKFIRDKIFKPSPVLEESINNPETKNIDSIDNNESEEDNNQDQ